MSNAHQIGLDPKLQPPQPQLGHGNSNQLAPIPSTSYAPASSSSSSSVYPSSKHHHEYEDSPKSDLGIVTFGAADGGGPVSEHDDSAEDVAAGIVYTEEPKPSPFNSQWICSQDFVLYHTPSRKDDITHFQELALRRKGTCFIRQVVSSLKLKPICKETAYIYFHRFFMLRSLKKHDSCRIGSACIYLACKYEDHPSYKEHMVRIYHLLVHRKDIAKTDKEYPENCERLIQDENLLLQALGFDSLGIRHFQVLIVESSMQHPVEGTSKELYSNAYKIASEINRLTMLCVEQPSPILACVSIYLAAVYQGIILPDGWTSSVKGATSQDMELVVKLGEEYKDRIAKDSDLVKAILRVSGVRCLMPPGNAYCSPGDSSRGSTPVYLARNDPISQQILTTFSPDSAYSSNSSHSPPENASSYGNGSQPRIAQAHLTSHPTPMMNYPPSIHQSKPSKQPAQLHQTDVSYSPTATTSASSCYGVNSTNSHRHHHDSVGTVSKRTAISGKGPAKVGGTVSASMAAKNAASTSLYPGATVGAAGQINTHPGSGGSSRKRSYPYSASASNLNPAESVRPSNMLPSSRMEMAATSGAGSDSHRKRVKIDPHSNGSNSSNSSNSKHRQQQQQLASGHSTKSVGGSRSMGHATNNNNNQSNVALSFVKQHPHQHQQRHSGSGNSHHHHHYHQQQHQSMPHF